MNGRMWFINERQDVLRVGGVCTLNGRLAWTFPLVCATMAMDEITMSVHDVWLAHTVKLYLLKYRVVCDTFQHHKKIRCR